MCPAGLGKISSWPKSSPYLVSSVPDELKILLADAQTSGGLLLAVSPEHYQEAQDLLFAKGSAIVADIGVVTHQDEHPVVVS